MWNGEGHGESDVCRRGYFFFFGGGGGGVGG